MMWPPPCGDTSFYTVNYSPSLGSHSILITAAGDRLGHEATADGGGGRCEGCRCMKKAVERFPDQADLIGRLVEQSETFRSLCEDHQLAVETLDTLTARRPMDDKIVHEYRTLIEDLEVDIATALNKLR
jgi:hypothetical protein